MDFTFESDYITDDQGNAIKCITFRIFKPSKKECHTHKLRKEDFKELLQEITNFSKSIKSKEAEE